MYNESAFNFKINKHECIHLNLQTLNMNSLNKFKQTKNNNKIIPCLLYDYIKIIKYVNKLRTVYQYFQFKKAIRPLLGYQADYLTMAASYEVLTS